MLNEFDSILCVLTCLSLLPCLSGIAHNFKPESFRLTLPKSTVFHKRIFDLSSTTAPQKLNARAFSTDLTHVDEHGKAKMVNVGDKRVTKRVATAKGVVKVGTKIALLIAANAMKKGDVLTIAELAGILGAKKTSDLIPLCHNIPISSVKVSASLNTETEEVIIMATVQTEGKTGVEMEALTAVALAALTVYDMCKAVSHNIIIKEIILMEKTGGRSNFIRESSDYIMLNYTSQKIEKSETFSPDSFH
jgi:molybdenum cofactor biosynthesis protein MoaC